MLCALCGREGERERGRRREGGGGREQRETELMECFTQRLQLHLNSDQPLRALGDVPGDSDVGSRGFLDAVDLSAAATNHSSY